LIRGNKVFFFSQCLSAEADPLRLGGFAACPAGLREPVPQNCGETYFFSFLLAKAQSRIRRGGLCGLAALRANNFFFFYSRQGAEPQRNSGPPTSGRLTEKEKYPFFAPSLLCAPYSFLFFSPRRRAAKELWSIKKRIPLP
jgi:hypothetical protein